MRCNWDQLPPFINMFSQIKTVLVMGKVAADILIGGFISRVPLTTGALIHSQGCTVTTHGTCDV